MNSEYIKNNLTKNNFIKKNLLRMDDIKDVNINYIKHFIKIISSNPKELDLIHISYNNYQSFFKLYKAMLNITNNDMADTGFLSMTRAEQLSFLSYHNIKHSISNQNNIIIESFDYETTYMIGVKAWCITRSKLVWDNYNKNKDHLIIITNNNIYGVSISKNSFYCFDQMDHSVTYDEIKNILPKKYVCNNKKTDTKIKINHFLISFFSLLILLSIVDFYSPSLSSSMLMVINYLTFVYGCILMLKSQTPKSAYMFISEYYLLKGSILIMFGPALSSFLYVLTPLLTK